MEAVDEAAARLASRNVPSASSSAAVGGAGGVVPRRLFLSRKCMNVDFRTVWCVVKYGGCKGGRELVDQC